MSTHSPATTLVASDLDRTLISLGRLARPVHAGRGGPRLLCVEVYGHKPSLVHDGDGRRALTEVAADATVFVPTTTRTREQYGRIHLPAPPPVRDLRQRRPHPGRRASDRDRQQRVESRIAAECALLTEVRAHLATTADPAWLLKERVAEDLFAYLVVERSLLPEEWVKELAAWARPRGWTVSLQGRKIYAVPAPLTKSAAMHEVARRTGATARSPPATPCSTPTCCSPPTSAGAPATANRPTRAGGPRTWWPFRSGAGRRGRRSCAASWRPPLREFSCARARVARGWGA